jgi:hypothetical protein
MADHSLLGALYQTWLTWRRRQRERVFWGGYHPLDVKCLACGMPKNAPCVGQTCLQRISDAEHAG